MFFTSDKEGDEDSGEEDKRTSGKTILKKFLSVKLTPNINEDKYEENKSEDSDSSGDDDESDFYGEGTVYLNLFLTRVSNLIIVRS